jgi:MerR family mercuric resistance operon transcriptional regulator
MVCLTTGAVAKAAGVNIDTVRYYERIQLLDKPPRSASGYRQYGGDAVRRIAFIKRAQRLGFTLAEAADLLELHTSIVPCEEVERRIEAKVAQIEEKIAALVAVRDALLATVARCDSDCETGCTVLLGDPPDNGAACLEMDQDSVSPHSGKSEGCCVSAS